MMLDAWSNQGLSDQLATMLEQIILGQNWSGAAEWKQKWRQAEPYNVLQCFRTLCERDDISEAIAAIRVPTLVIHGGADIAITPDRARQMAEAIPGARFELIMDAGHAANLTHPDAVTPLIERFLAELH
jgi:pimeloyl-ACP methyl ester carboxylesterase